MEIQEYAREEKKNPVVTINRGLNLIWKEFIYGGHFQSLGASSIVMISSMLLDIQITWSCLVASYLIFYPMYLYNRFKEIEIDYLTNPQRTTHIKKYLRIIPAILLLDLVVLFIILIYFSNQITLIFSTILVFLGILYTIIFKKITKNVAFFKNFYVAMFYAFMVFFPILYYNHEITLAASALALFTYLKALAMQVLLDVKDIETDEKQELLTLPILFGKEKTLKIFKIVNVIMILTIIAVSYCFNVFPKIIMTLLFVIPFNFYCAKLVQKNNYFGYILSGGEFILWSLLIIIAKNIIIC